MLGVIGEFETEAPMNITVGRDVNGDGLTTDWVNEAICRNLACPGAAYSRNSVREMTFDEASRLHAQFGFASIERFDENPQYFNADVTLQWTPTLGGTWSRRAGAWTRPGTCRRVSLPDSRGTWSLAAQSATSRRGASASQGSGALHRRPAVFTRCVVAESGSISGERLPGWRSNAMRVASRSNAVGSS